MGNLKSARAELEAREAVAEAYLQLSRHDLSKIGARLSTPPAMGIISTAGFLTGLLNSRRSKSGEAAEIRGDLKKYRSKLDDDIRALLATELGRFRNESGHSVGQEEDKVSLREGAFTIASSLATSVLSRVLYAKYFAEAEPELDLAEDA